MPLRPILITPSILSADLAHLQDEVSTIEKHADWLQVDVMDGHFVPNLSFGAPVVQCLQTSLPLDIHLMVTNPADRIDEFLVLGVKNITFHAEAVQGTADRRDLIRRIHQGKATAGIALNPETPVAAIDDALHELDLVLILSVHPGYSGQAFLPDALEKVRSLRSRLPDLMIQMDGGITVENAGLCIEAGADNLVAASAVFGAPDRAKAIAELRGTHNE
ncbi:ribulose-phosphate 3-epimerase [Candidatus Peregrinibacteria bacterium]|nr:ribulose-phosphate 3-epimerase [Candidatus Peregrinibacteria bacterium]MBI3816342.1 ribulose-phosphate 3-epimerase [Candidatus Peregrinibacteria bacterium]